MTTPRYEAPFTLARYLDACREDLAAYFTGVTDSNTGDPMQVSVYDGGTHAMGEHDVRLYCTGISSADRRLGEGYTRTTFAAILTWGNTDAADRAAELVAWATELADPSVLPGVVEALTLEYDAEVGAHYRMTWAIDYKPLYTRRSLPEDPEIRSVTVIVQDADTGADLETIVSPGSGEQDD